MDWMPDQIRSLADALQERADRNRLAELTPATARLVCEALRFFAAEGFGMRVEMLIVEAADHRNGGRLEVVGESVDVDATRALFNVICRKRPGSQITLRKRGWVLGSKRPGEPPPGAA